jgi:hypothetical protein
MTLTRVWTVTSSVDPARTLRITIEGDVLTLAVVVDGGSVVEVQMNKADQEGLRAAAMEALAVP